MRLSPDQQIFWQHGFIKLNATIVTTWALMLALALGSKLITRNLATEERDSRWQRLAGNHRHRNRKTDPGSRH